MSVSSWSLDQLRVSPSLRHVLLADVGRVVFGYWPSLEKADYSQKATKSHVTKIVDLWVMWLGLRHTWGEYCHPSNTAQSGFMKKNEGT